MKDYKEYLHSILNGEYKPMEAENDLLFLKELYYKDPFDVYIYGTGSRAFTIYHMLKQRGIHVKYFIDPSKNKHGATFIDVQIVAIERLGEVLINNKSVVIIASTFYDNDFYIKQNVDKILYDFGVGQIINGNHWCCSNALNKLSWNIYYYNSSKELDYVIDNLFDNYSKEIFCELIRASFYNDFFRLKEHDVTSKYWDESVYKPSDKEVIVNIGASIGDSIIYYNNTVKNFEKIYAIEADEFRAHICNKNLRQYLGVNLKKVEVLIKKIGDGHNGTESLDKLFIDKGISIINADAEGCELEILKGAQNLINLCKPIFALCAYHKKEDYFEFIKFINDCNCNYRFYLRKYPSLFLGACEEQVLYAIPEHRCLF